MGKHSVQSELESSSLREPSREPSRWQDYWQEHGSSQNDYETGFRSGSDWGELLGFLTLFFFGALGVLALVLYLVTL